MIRLTDLKKHDNGWKLIEQCEICAEDLKLYKPQALCHMGTYQKCFILYSLDGYRNFITCNPNCSAEVGRYYDLTDIVLQEIEKDGKHQQRCLLKSDLGLQ